MRRSSGFSLIELMVVIAIMALLAAFAIPGYSNWVGNSRVRSATEALANDLRRAQAEAVRRSHQVALVRTTGNPTSATVAASNSGTNWFVRVINLVATEVAGDSAMDGGGFFVKGETTARQLGVTINGDTMICFNSLGRPVANSTTTSDAFTLTCTAPTATQPKQFNIAHTSADRPLRITVDIGGKIRTCDPAKSISASPDGC